MRFRPETGTFSTGASASAGGNLFYAIESSSRNNLILVAGNLADQLAAIYYNSVSGGLETTQTLTTLNSPRSIAIHPDGGFAYAGYVSVAGMSIYSIATQSNPPVVANVAHFAHGGITYYDLKFTPDGRYLLGSIPNTKQISVYEANSTTGYVTYVGQGPVLPVAEFLAVAPNGRTIYSVGYYVDDSVSALRLDPSTGALSLIATYNTGQGTIGGRVKVSADGNWLFVGNQGPTITLFRIDSDGALTMQGTHSVGEDCSVLNVLLDPRGNWVFAVCGATNEGTLRALRFDSSKGSLSLVSKSDYIFTQRGAALLRQLNPKLQ
ncbi:MAG: lactonase family protein [Bacteriovoracia bacterium]